jgi:penicillin-binding protein 1A
VWRDFMQTALGVGPAAAPEPVEEVDPDAGNSLGDALENFLDPSAIPPVEGEIPGVGRIRLRNGEIDFAPTRPDQRDRRREAPDDRAPRRDQSDPNDDQ